MSEFIIDLCIYYDAASVSITINEKNHKSTSSFYPINETKDKPCFHDDKCSQVELKYTPIQDTIFVIEEENGIKKPTIYSLDLNSEIDPCINKAVVVSKKVSYWGICLKHEDNCIWIKSNDNTDKVNQIIQIRRPDMVKYSYNPLYLIYPNCKKCHISYFTYDFKWELNHVLFIENKIPKYWQIRASIKVKNYPNSSLCNVKFMAGQSNIKPLRMHKQDREEKIHQPHCITEIHGMTFNREIKENIIISKNLDNCHYRDYLDFETGRVYTGLEIGNFIDYLPAGRLNIYDISGQYLGGEDVIENFFQHKKMITSIDNKEWECSITPNSSNSKKIYSLVIKNLTSAIKPFSIHIPKHMGDLISPQFDYITPTHYILNYRIETDTKNILIEMRPYSMFE